MPEVIPTAQDTQLTPTSQSAGGVIQQLKEGKIKRKAALEALQKVTSAKLEVLTHQLQEATKVKKAEATITADKFLKELDLQNQEVMQALGLRNEAIRRETRNKLNEETHRDLKEILSKDYPDFMMETTLKANWFRRWRRSPVDPLDELYIRLRTESENLVSEKIRQFNQTARHES